MGEEFNDQREYSRIDGAYRFLANGAESESSKRPGAGEARTVANPSNRRPESQGLGQSWALLYLRPLAAVSQIQAQTRQTEAQRGPELFPSARGRLTVGAVALTVAVVGNSSTCLVGRRTRRSRRSRDLENHPSSRPVKKSFVCKQGGFIAFVSGSGGNGQGLAADYGMDRRDGGKRRTTSTHRQQDG